ncbi:MAG: tRNA pseudouridine(38-40) synthase TruA [Candidatus Sumerlaeota bacterium]|nr:tRNA pseudouridine(38-40) synthase TruA [Candidatus Sumerlaeota bacterium]
MRNLLLTLQYGGERYCGWQRQPGGLSVQQAVEEALEPINGGPVRLHAAGRTDAGVHAEGQTANFRTESSHSPRAFLRAGNARLPEDIAIVAAVEVPLEFDARRDARVRWYRYRVFTAPVRPVFRREQLFHCHWRLDEERGQKALAVFRGRRDFAGMRSAQCSAKRTMLDLECSLTVTPARWTFDFQSRSFLHNMVRILVGAVLEAARGRIGVEELEAILRSRRRDSRIPTAPARGLTLMAIGYPPEKVVGAWIIPIRPEVW